MINSVVNFMLRSFDMENNNEKLYDYKIGDKVLSSIDKYEAPYERP
jgi:hypothetical protein